MLYRTLIGEVEITFSNLLFDRVFEIHSCDLKRHTEFCGNQKVFEWVIFLWVVKYNCGIPVEYQLCISDKQQLQKNRSYTRVKFQLIKSSRLFHINMLTLINWLLVEEFNPWFEVWINSSSSVQVSSEIMVLLREFARRDDFMGKQE